MAQKSWHLSRRTLLRASGACLALPWLEAMGAASPMGKAPKRFFADADLTTSVLKKVTRSVNEGLQRIVSALTKSGASR